MDVNRVQGWQFTTAIAAPIPASGSGCSGAKISHPVPGEATVTETSNRQINFDGITDRGNRNTANRERVQ
jgi:hypothetical protein